MPPRKKTKNYLSEREWLPRNIAFAVSFPALTEMT